MQSLPGTGGVFRLNFPIYVENYKSFIAYPLLTCLFVKVLHPIMKTRDNKVLESPIMSFSRKLSRYTLGLVTSLSTLTSIHASTSCEAPHDPCSVQLTRCILNTHTAQQITRCHAEKKACQAKAKESTSEAIASSERLPQPIQWGRAQL